MSGLANSFQLGVRAARQPHREHRALARLGRHRHISAHHARELAGAALCFALERPGWRHAAEIIATHHLEDIRAKRKSSSGSWAPRTSTTLRRPGRKRSAIGSVPTRAPWQPSAACLKKKRAQCSRSFRDFLAPFRKANRASVNRLTRALEKAQYDLSAIATESDNASSRGREPCPPATRF
jgi:hypothetical protein